MEAHRVSVRHLAEFVHSSGDLFEPGGRVRAEEGIAAHATLQQKRKREGFSCEHTVTSSINRKDLQLEIRGRADAVHLAEQRVEEFKTSRRIVEACKSEHMAQACLYAALLDEGGRSWRISVSYVHPDSFELTSFHCEKSSAELAAFLEQTITEYTAWLADFAEHRRLLKLWTEALRFPFEQPRPYQRALAAQCAQVLSEGRSLLIEAPTGSGKTMAVLYPAIKQLKKRQRVWFLTSRRSGRRAAEDALRVICADQRPLRVVSIHAKEQICPVPGTPCDPRACEYASGYYDRRAPAVAELLEGVVVDRSAIEKVSEKHKLCPFEVTLDAALWCDVIIGDYNYVFDPVVRLQRFASDDAQLLIDEAHHLADRVAMMLSLSLDRYRLKDALATAPVSVAKKLRALDRQLLTLRREYPASVQEPQKVTIPSGIERAVSAVAGAVQDWLAEHPEASMDASLQAFFFDCTRWLRGAPWRQMAEYLDTLDATYGKNIRIDATCIDASAYIADRLEEYCGDVRFSATVSPPELFQAAHGRAGADFARAGSPFSSNQLSVAVVPDLPTYYRQRQRSIGALTEAVQAILRAKPGRYLLCFPSYAYLDLFVQHYDGHVLQQCSDMDESAREQFLSTLASSAEVLAVAVLGGVFTESVDLSDTPLAGVIVVGVAIPPPSLVREASATWHHRSGRDGHLVSYVQPGMTKIVQAAGRLIRSPHHKGVLVLIDARYLEATYRQFFPALWQPQVVKHKALSEHLAAFWEDRSETEMQ